MGNWIPEAFVGIKRNLQVVTVGFPECILRHFPDSEILRIEIAASGFVVPASGSSCSTRVARSSPLRIVARMVWVKVRKSLDDFISSQKPIYRDGKSLEEIIVVELTKAIIANFNIPSNGYGFAVLMALIIAKVEFSVSPIGSK